MSGEDHYLTNPLLEPLTRRERDVLSLLAQGLTGPEIAEKLTLAVSSVKWHSKHIYAKLGVNSKRQAIARAHALGLLSAPPGATAPDPSPPLPGVPVSASSQTAQSLAARRHNLPLQVTRFFGREAEVAQLIERLSENRLVTLTGPGGAGKTRLSLRTAEEVLDDFADGVWIVELAPLYDPALVLPQIATTLGVRDEPDRPVLETLTNQLRERQFLLVLDNCEHLLAVCANVAGSLLRACPRVRILATSREPLGVAGEALFSVPSLPYPDAGVAVAAEKAREYAAVRLFLDRARLVTPDYQLGSHNVAAVAQICQRLDGIPLAIEMAAARINVLSADQLSSRLQDVFRVLAGGSRTALPRQQTLRATIDWSYNLLSDDERLLLQRLSVFAGGCTLEATEAICSGDGLAAGDVLNLLASLVAKSMVVADRQPGVEARYHLLEIVRQYAGEMLHNSGESVRLRTHHRDYYLSIAENYRLRHLIGQQTLWHHKFMADIDNFRRALEWSFSDESNVDAAPRLLNAIEYHWPWAETGLRLRQGLAWCQNHPDVSDGIHALLLCISAGPISGNDPQAGIAMLGKAIDMSRSLGRQGRELLMRSLNDLAELNLELRADASPAVAPLAEAEAILEELRSDGLPSERYLWERAWIELRKAELGNGDGHYQAAKANAGESIRIFVGMDDRWNSILPLIQLGIAGYRLGEFEPARDTFLSTMTLTKEFEDQRAYVLRWLGAVDLGLANLDRALEYCRESLQVALDMPDYNTVASGLGLCACIAAKQGQPMRSARLSGAAQALYAKQHRNAWEDSSLDTLLPGWRERPDQTTIQQSFVLGQTMSAEQAVAFALGDEDEIG